MRRSPAYALKLTELPCVLLTVLFEQEVERSIQLALQTLHVALDIGFCFSTRDLIWLI